MPQSAIAIIGTEGSGKSVFVAALAHVLQDAPVGQTRLVPKDMQTARYCATIVDQLNAGQRPASTAAGTLESLAWDWIEPDGTIHPMSVLDCAGQDFRQIFEGSNALDPHQQKLSAALHAAKVVILLVNLNEAIEAHGLSQTRRLDMEFAPAMALRALNKSGAVTMLILSQHDIYRDHLESEQLASPAEALRKYLPQLANAAEETQTCVAFCSAIKTQVVSTNGISELRPIGIRLTELPSVAGQIQRSLKLVQKSFCNKFTPSISQQIKPINADDNKISHSGRNFLLGTLITGIIFWIGGCHVAPKNRFGWLFKPFEDKHPTSSPGLLPLRK